MNMVVLTLSKYLWNIVCYIVYNNLYRFLLTAYLYFRYTPIMCPRKSARDGGKESKKTTRATLGVKKEIIAEHENVVRVSDHA